MIFDNYLRLELLVLNGLLIINTFYKRKAIENYGIPQFVCPCDSVAPSD